MTGPYTRRPYCRHKINRRITRPITRAFYKISVYENEILSSRNEKEIARVCMRFAFARFVSQRQVNSQRQLLINYFVRLNEIII